MASTVRDFLLAQIEKKLSEAKNVTEQAEKAARALADDEKHHIERLLEDVTKLKADVKEIDDRDQLQKSIDDMRGPVSEEPETVANAQSLGDAFVKSESYRTLKGTHFQGSKWTTGGIEYPHWPGKATVTEAASAIVTPDYRPGIQPILFERLTVLDLLGQATTNSTSISVVNETTATNAAAAVTPGDDKPESTIIFTPDTEPVRKIATFLPVTDEFLEDVDGIRTYLDSRLRLFVQLKEEQQVLSGTGDAPQLEGIMDAGRSIQTGAALLLDSDSSTDAIFQAMTAIRTTSFLEPDGIVIHPTNWAQIRLLKDANEQYYGGGPFTGAYGNGTIARDSLWGLPVVVTSAMTVGTVLVGAFRSGATVFRRSGLTVEASNSHDDFFQKNLTAIRAETRLGLAVHRPSAFYAITNITGLIS